jgi:hypothetical protein
MRRLADWIWYELAPWVALAIGVALIVHGLAGVAVD